MKKMFLIFMLFLLFITIGCQKSADPIISNNEGSQTTEEHIAFFSQELSQEDLIQLTEDYNISEISELRFKIGKITAGYSTRSLNIKSEVKNGLQVHIAHTNEMLEQEKNYSVSKADVKRMTAQQKLISRLQNSVDLATHNNYSFTGINIRTNDNEIVNRLIDDGIVKGSFIKSAEPDKSGVQRALSGDDNWAPDYGYTSVCKNYSYQRFVFDNVSGYNPMNGYEHETHIYSTDYVDYDGYWGSDMPHPYLDTQILDSGWPRNYAIGTTDPDGLQTYRTYYAYIAFRSASATNTCYVHTKGQKGWKLSSGCHDWAWCVIQSLATSGLDEAVAPVYNHYWTN